MVSRPVTFSLRAASEADRPFCWQLLQESMKPYVAATWGWDEADQLARFEAAFDPRTAQIIEIDDHAVGLLQVDFSSTPVRLLNIQLAPSFQGRGVGRGIIRVVLEQAGGRGVWLQVLKVNPAKRLYERMGFRPIEETETHWQMLYNPTSNRSSMDK